MKSQIPEFIYDNGEHKIKYLFHKGNYAPEKLIIVFSAFPPEGKLPNYQYIKCFSEMDCNKLYILDTYGPNKSEGGSCYYLGKDRNFTVEKVTVELIEKILLENEINKENVISVGTSKGGWASLYFTIKYGFGTAIAGAPQYYLGNFLNTSGNKKYLKYIAGGDTKEDVEYLNSLLPNLVKNSEELPNLYLHIGSGEFHYKDHVKHMIDDLEKREVTYNLDIPDYNSHGDVGKYFIPFLVPTIEELLEKRDTSQFEKNQKIPFLYSIHLNKINPQKAGTSILCTIEATGEKKEYAWYILKDGERIKATPYTTQNSLEWVPTEQGTYKFVGFVRDYKDNRDFKYSKEIVIYDFEISSINVKNYERGQVGETWNCTIEATGENLEYAWYIYKGEERIKTIPYSTRNFLEWIPTEQGVYKFTGFVKNQQGIIQFKSSDKYNVHQ